MPQIKSQQGSGTAGLLTASAIFVALLVYANQYAFIDSEAQAEVETVPEAIRLTAAHSAPAVTPTDNPATDQAAPTRAIANPGLALSDPQPMPVAIQPAPAVQADYTAASHWYPVSTVAYPDDHYAADFNGTSDHQLAAYQYLDNRADGRGRGRGRGAANGDGEFDFSMNFKSRARFDADTDFDGDWSGNGNGAYYGNYYQDTAYHPAYSYGYYRY